MDSKPSNKTNQPTTQIELFGGANLPETLKVGDKTAKIGFSLRSANDGQLELLGKKSFKELREGFKSAGHKGKVLTAMVESAMKEQTLDISRSVTNRISSFIDKGARVEKLAEYRNQRGQVRMVSQFVLRPKAVETIDAEIARLQAERVKLAEASTTIAV